MKQTMLERFSRTVTMRDIGDDAAENIRALRLICLAREQGACLKRNLTIHFGDELYAVRFLVLLQAIGTAWPEPVVVHRACCHHLSHDEATIAAIISIRQSGDRAQFDLLLGEMIPDDGRNLIWTISGALSNLVP